MNTFANRPRWEVADVLRRFTGSYAEQRRLPLSHTRVIQSIIDCRTAALGGHLERCGTCEFERPVYNSCRNRHCPKCQTMTKERWLEARKAELLPVDYFHKVFTLPHELNALTLVNKRVILGILFKTVADTLLSFGKDPRSRLGGKVGFSLILHTWNQQLMDHFHLHCVIPAGALQDDDHTWIKGKCSSYLFSVKALGIVFRNKFLAALISANDDGRLIFPGAVAPLGAPTLFASLIETLRSKEWVVYSKAPFGGPEHVLEYLGRYTHRVAISNNRLQNVNDDTVSFSFRDRADGNKQKTTSIAGIEFVRRFLLHVLPRGFVRIRHFGFLASRNKSQMLAKCREALSVAQTLTVTTRKATETILLEKCGIDIHKCPKCATGRMSKIAAPEITTNCLWQRHEGLAGTVNTS